MSLKKSLAASLLIGLLSTGVQAAPSDFVSPNVPLTSPLYGYIEKFDGMGYLTSMPNGTKPYTRMQMAQWLIEIQAESRKRPLPPYMADMEKELEKELTAEVQILSGEKADLSLELREVQLELGTYHGDTVGYRKGDAGPRASYQPLNGNNNGYRYGQNGNVIAQAQLFGKISPDMVIALEPRFSYDEDQQGEAALTSGYVKTRINGMGVQLGKDPVFWGHGATGSLILGNNMTPLTSIKLSNLEPYTSNGFFRFLGEMNFTAMYSELESNRTKLSANEVDNPSFVAMRGTFTPQRNFTFGLSFTSMVGGNGHSLSSGDYRDWLLGRNADAAADKWNNIAGLDFKLRLPKWNGVQVYGELYGEDQANYMPSKVAERVGVYIPKLNNDGTWDMKVEYAHTSNWWYNHQLYTNGYVYKGDIIGDPLGHDSNQYYVKVGRYLDTNSQISLNVNFVTMDRSAVVSQTIKSGWLAYQTKLRESVFLDSQLGIARINNAGFVSGHEDTNYFAGVSVRWQY
ncbi:capsule assembly Wzi family protein [Sporomusa acidovorans]|uniref:Capsule assembly protein Wzi n=1 Tax=Sporomusa acidovorans (strain ATCC 49682 / DSM 3132 / Mol) TaxID=1123286 RepID=A0ABZ3J8A9_SPOA4|nr:capsule assembly Wzi family protein [Sporomusa acidovorans]OZC19353.1 hypothetical protein SPACI_29430 [Sporomusa acidovorans DSM 3132]SDD79723.1 Capsule assembly protein Wzi [Sporomusa acidovorans]